MTEGLGALARELSLPYYEEALPAHDRFHANRVRRLALTLAAECEDEVDREVLAAAAWLHDIGRPRERTGAIEDHGDWAASEARTLLEAEGVPESAIAAIEHCLRAHSIRSSSPEPTTPEARCLFDADKLDAAGARGIVRLACIVGERSGRAGEAYAAIEQETVPGAPDPEGADVSLLRTWARERLDALYTEPARERSERRWAVMEEFFAAFEREAELEQDRQAAPNQ